MLPPHPDQGAKAQPLASQSPPRDRTLTPHRSHLGRLLQTATIVTTVRRHGNRNYLAGRPTADVTGRGVCDWLAEDERLRSSVRRQLPESERSNEREKRSRSDHPEEPSDALTPGGSRLSLRLPKEAATSSVLKAP